jgi:hypothetical protein
MSGPAGKQGPPAVRHSCAAVLPDHSQCALSGARHQTSCFLLTVDLHGCRQTGSYRDGREILRQQCSATGVFFPYYRLQGQESEDSPHFPPQSGESENGQIM